MMRPYCLLRRSMSGSAIGRNWASTPRAARHDGPRFLGWAIDASHPGRRGRGLAELRLAQNAGNQERPRPVAAAAAAAK